MNEIPVIDIFAGPGGLGEGFSAYSKNKTNPFKIRLSVEKDIDAYQTLKLRSLYRKFPKGKAPAKYYKFIRKNSIRDLNELLRQYPNMDEELKKEVKLAELGGKDFPEEIIDSWIKDRLDGYDKWVLIGGPPCQAYSTAGRSKHRSLKGYSPEKDHRNFLYLEYLRIIANHWPAVFVMENVRGILSSKIKKKHLFPKILEDLSAPAKVFNGDITERKYKYKIYSLVTPCAHKDLLNNPDFRPSDFIIKSEDYGIPQARHRVILLGVREDLGEIVPRILKKRKTPTTEDVLGDLPVLRGGISKGQDSYEGWFRTIYSIQDEQWLKELDDDIREEILRLIKILEVPHYQRGKEYISTRVQCSYRKNWFHDRKLKGVINSITKEHMRSDLKRYFFAAVFAQVKGRSPVLPDFPEELLPNHKNIRNTQGEIVFADRFRVQVRHRPSTTVMSHISKDGHYYIHYDPLQCRSLTVREAARLQTFPDNYCFMGSRTSQYTQVGNAVPPLLAYQIAEIVYEIFTRLS